MTRTPQLLLISASILSVAIPATPSAQAQPGYGQPGYGTRITCSSDNGRRNWCDIGNSRDAQLVRQISGSACVQGDTWGIDQRGLWVDRGCRAEFAIGRGGGSPPVQTINCSSDNGRRNWCDIGNSRDAQLVRQISGSACVQGDTWGIDQRGLWVDRGCRAEFAIGRGGGSPPVQTLNCSSDDGRRNWCAIGASRDVQLVRQISGSPCVRGDTWGVDQRGLWVDRGCRADFSFGRSYGPPSGPQQPQLITCSSDNGKRNWCDTGGRRNIILNRQISGSACVQGDTWGIDQRGLWVDRGCRAEFRLR